jgi:uncharacterized protein (TIGR02246 family)
MPRFRPTILASLVALALWALPQPSGAQVANPSDAVEIMVQAVTNRDAEAVAALYAPDALVLGPGSAPLSGRDAIRDAWAGNFRHGYSNLEVGRVRTERGTDRAAMFFYWRATFQPEGQQPRQITGRSLLYLTLVEGGWLISADMWHRPEQPQ